MNPNLLSFIDHLVIGAHTLEEGRNYVHQTLGIFPESGGEHITMGTHNCLLKLGNSIYLEVIAVNRDVRQPDRPHWFGLDEFFSQSKPRLLTWVVRTNDVNEAKKRSNISFGEIENMDRGNLEWLITVMQDGSMPMQGVAPTLIQWKTDQHPTDSLSESGCSLVQIEGYHPKAKVISEVLQSICFEGIFSVEKSGQDTKPSLIAYIEIQKGIRKFIS
jgi:Glyoxalase-like domain